MELFTSAKESLNTAAASISAEMAKLFTWQKLPPGINWDEYGDWLEILHTRLLQLNGVIHVEYTFEEGLPNDVINYAKLLTEAGTVCDELIGFLLSREEMFKDDIYVKYEVLFLKEVLTGIIESSTNITRILSKHV